MSNKNIDFLYAKFIGICANEALESLVSGIHEPNTDIDNPHIEIDMASYILSVHKLGAIKKLVKGISDSYE